ncbi:hypothetical protein [Rhodococcus sp. JT-3]|uniref:hypothetical protein n=1 Tax=Rhodococcus sp. JT-3 TaxID=1973213 RepID=UPI0018EED342|nr:hypothetical protein [Rhodococcus sp. JT-3]
MTVMQENVRLELWRDYFREADGSLTCTWLVDGNISALPADEIPRVIGYLWQLQRTHSVANPGPGIGEDLIGADAERTGECL